MLGREYVVILIYAVCILMYSVWCSIDILRCYKYTHTHTQVVSTTWLKVNDWRLIQFEPEISFVCVLYLVLVAYILLYRYMWTSLLQKHSLPLHIRYTVCHFKLSVMHLCSIHDDDALYIELRCEQMQLLHTIDLC